MASETDARNGTTTFAYDNLDRRTVVTTPSPGGGQSVQSTTNFFNNMGRVWKTGMADGSSMTNEFFVMGLLRKTSGSRTYPVEYTYDYRGRMKTMKTWRDFANNSQTATTTWNYDVYSGLLTNKAYADGNGITYTYSSAGRVLTRKWARGTTPLTCTYAYDNAGGTTSLSYNDSGATPAVTYTYDRLGRQKTITRNGITTTLTYNDAGQLASEAYSGGTLNGLMVTNRYDSLLRRTSVEVPVFSATLQSYAYDNASRLQGVTNGGYFVTYAYLTNSLMIETATFKTDSTTRLTVSKGYDFLNRQTSVSSTPSAASTVSFGYQYNQANQRTNVALADGSNWRHAYDSLGQVTSGKRYWSDGVAVAGQQFEYQFDDLGNRKTSKAGGDASGSSLRTSVLPLK